MKFVEFLKKVFVSQFWIKAICFVLAFLLIFALNVVKAGLPS